MTDVSNAATIAAEKIQDKTPLEVGDVVSEYQKKWVKQMEDIIAKHKDYAPKYYVLQWIYKEHGHANLLRNRTIIRRSMPDPDWNTDCYSFDNRTNEMTVEWTLPPKEAVHTILKNAHQYDPFLLECIKKYTHKIAD